MKIVRQHELENIFNNIAVATIGPMTTKTISGYGMNVDIEPVTHTIEELANAIESYFNKKNDAK